MAFRYVISLCALIAYANAGLLASHVAIANPSVDAVASTQQNVVRSFAGTVSSYSKAVDTPYSSVRKSDTRINNNVYQPAIAKSIGYAAAPLYTQATPVLSKTVLPAPVLEKSVEITPAITKTLYAAPAVAKTVSYAAPAVTYAAPAIAKTVYAAPAPVLTKTLSYAAPAVTYAAHAPVVAKTVSYAAPAVSYAAPAPVVAKTVSYAAPAVSYAAPAVAYAAPAPVVAKTVSYAAPSTHISHGPAATTYTHNAPGVSSYGSAQTVHYSPAETVSHMSFDGFGTHWGF